MRDKADPETLNCVDFSDLYPDVGRPAGWSPLVLKGVLGSLVAEGFLIVEEHDANFRKQTFYWTPEQYSRLAGN